MKNEPKALETPRIDRKKRTAALRKAALTMLPLFALLPSPAALTTLPLFALAAFPATLSAQTRTGDGGSTVIEHKIEIDKTIHDFGDVTVSDEKLKCSFQLKNISPKPAVIYNVVSSCGCTDIEWTRKPLAQGETGAIEVTYTNDSGPYPFDKTLTVYVSGLRKPVILRLRGIVHRKKEPLSRRYPVRFGSLGFQKTEIRLGNLTQGDRKGDFLRVANLGKTPLRLTFTEVSEQLDLKVEPNPIPAGAEAEIACTVTSDKRKWGNNLYCFTPVANGRKLLDKTGGAPVRIVLRAYTKEDFSAWSKEEIKRGAQPLFETGSCTLPAVRPGARVTAEFRYTNKGRRTSRIYKVDSELKDVEISCESEVPPGGEGRIRLSFSTDGLPRGEFMSLVTLTTNSPLRPIINLYIYGVIQ